MSKNITESDLELVKLGESLGLNLISFADLRQSQDDSFIDGVRSEALKKLKNKKCNNISQQDTFYAGSIDFMVSDTNNDKKFFLLETNGGSHRGLSILTTKQQEMLYQGYYQAIKNAIQQKKQETEKILILIGLPVDDRLIHEKVIMIEYLRKRLKKKGFSLKIFNIDNYDPNHKAELIFLVADYNQISAYISYSNNWVKFKEENVQVLIGDGIARRFNDKTFNSHVINNYREIKTVIVNPIFKITDDKSLTYLASFFTKNLLSKFNLKHLMFTKCFSEGDLIQKLLFLIKKEQKSFIIKPNGGSGGSGVLVVSKSQNKKNIIRIINESQEEFYDKFGDQRNPFPYTIQELADFCLINWRGEKHTYDLRIYVAQISGIIQPIGGLARISRGSYINGEKKQEFVVNLSGFNGQIEVTRGLGFSKPNANILNLQQKDFVDLFCISCIIFRNIINNYEKIITFSNWEKIIKFH
ncbi:MAG: hypothetical protein KGD73_02350 [Candidatus Lokiarchaeota archaeon]|nr:hypothetical protein [Candidatus Lokiarchaeota archaeon]